MLRSIILAFVWLPLATAFAYQPAAFAAADHGDTFDTVLGMAGPIPLLAEAAGAGIGQWENSPKEWGRGWGAYGERFESNLAYNGVRQTITYGTSVVFHEDNRYFPSHKHGFWARTGYAVLSTVTARHPDGRRAFFV